MKFARSLFLVSLLCFVSLAVACSRRAELDAPVPATESRGSPAEAALPGTTPRSNPRAIAREHQISMQAQSPAAVVEQLTTFTESQGGYVVNSQLRSAPRDETEAELSLRLPALKVSLALALLRKLGEIHSEQRKGDDVTAEVVDTNARLSARRALEKRLLELLVSARSVEDMLKVETELARVRTEIEQLTGQERALTDRTEMAQLTVTIESLDARRTRSPSFGARFKQACSSALSTSQNVILGTIEFLGVLLPLTLMGLLVWLPVRYFRRRAKRIRVEQQRLAFDGTEPDAHANNGGKYQG